MKIIEGDCWKCSAAMKIAIMHSPDDQIRGSTHPGPDLFNKQEVDFALSKGVIIKLQHSQTADDTYLANTCGSCDTLTGAHYLFDFFCDAEESKIKSDDYEVGYHCENCFLENEDKAHNEAYSNN